MGELKSKFQSLSKMISGVLLGDSSAADKAEAAEMLGLLSDDNSYYSLFEGLHESEPEVRKMCIKSIIRHNRYDAVGKIAEYLEDESPDVRLAAAEGLGNLGNASFVPALESYARRENVFPVREAIIKSIETLKNRLTKEEVRRLMEEKFKLELSQKDNEISALSEKLRNIESLVADTSEKNSILDTQFAAKMSKNRKIMSFVFAGIAAFVCLFLAVNYFVVRKLSATRKQAIQKETEHLSSAAKTLQESLTEKEITLAASTEYFEKSEEMFRALQKSGRSIYGKDPVAELLFEKVYLRFAEASKLPVAFDQKMKVREACLNIAELVRKKKMDKAIDDFTKLDEMIEGFKQSSQNAAQ